tara:strand:+ start:15480 stop:16673 length:1194 start_codon:yes stop_codon:yes gene_type:complete
MNHNELVKLKKDIQSFLIHEVYPLEKKLLTEGFNKSLENIEEKRDKVKSLGYWMPQISKEYGGMGLSLIEFSEISSILGSSPIGLYLFNCQAPDAGNMEILIEYGTKYQKDKFLKPLLDGKIRSCFSMTEPNHAGSNPVFMSTTAVKKNDSYIINGKKWYTSSAEGSSFAIVMAITNPSEKNKYLTASQIIVPTGSKGFKLIRKIPVMGDEGEGYFSHSEINYNDVLVPKENLLGKEGSGFKIAQSRLGPGRIHHCMRWIGICERSFDMMCKRAATRELSPGKFLGEKQLIHKMIAERRVEINAAKLLVMDVGRKIEKEGSKEARFDISMIKFYCANILKRVIDDAIQIHGGLGMSDDIILSHFYRHERAARIYDGADEVHITNVAKGILSKYGLKI